MNTMKSYYNHYNAINSIPPFSGVRTPYQYNYKSEDWYFHATCRECGKYGRCTCRVTGETDGFRYLWEGFEVFDIDRWKLIIGTGFSRNVIPRCPRCHSRQIEITEGEYIFFWNGGLANYTAKALKLKKSKMLKTLRNRIRLLSRSIKRIHLKPNLDIILDTLVVSEFSDTDRV